MQLPRMQFLPNYMDCLNVAAAQTAATVLVTITRTKGSAPRNTGTKMAAMLGENKGALIVGGTIGGGNLEYKALEIAAQWLRNRLQNNNIDALEKPENRAFPLGASLGQCCGGWVELQFEIITAAENISPAGWVQMLRNTPARNPFHVLLFGAGHVGQALAPMLRTIGANVVWVDTREDVFSNVSRVVNINANIETIITDAPESEITRAPSGCFFIIMTHSHALDQTLTHAMLQRGDASFYGLIGSRTKRKLFEKRLSMRGLSQSAIEKLVCPLGIDGINSKEPAAIALSITAQIQQRREQLLTQPHTNHQPISSHA